MKAQFNYPRDIVLENGQRQTFTAGTHEISQEVAEHFYFKILEEAGDVILFAEVAEKTKKPAAKKEEVAKNNEHKVEEFKLPTDYNALLALAKTKGVDVSSKPAKADVIKLIEEKLAEEAKEAESDLA